MPIALFRHFTYIKNVKFNIKRPSKGINSAIIDIFASLEGFFAFNSILISILIILGYNCFQPDMGVMDKVTIPTTF